MRYHVRHTHRGRPVALGGGDPSSLRLHRPRPETWRTGVSPTRWSVKGASGGTSPYVFTRPGPRRGPWGRPAAPVEESEGGGREVAGRTPRGTDVCRRGGRGRTLMGPPQRHTPSGTHPAECAKRDTPLGASPRGVVPRGARRIGTSPMGRPRWAHVATTGGRAVRDPGRELAETRGSATVGHHPPTARSFPLPSRLHAWPLPKRSELIDGRRTKVSWREEEGASTRLGSKISRRAKPLLRDTVFPYQMESPARDHQSGRRKAPHHAPCYVHGFCAALVGPPALCPAAPK
jgi:hypothetical protein